MAPSAIPVDSHEDLAYRAKDSQKKVGLDLSGALEQFAWEDVTPTIGREFAEANIVNDILNSPDSEKLLRDLAITSKLESTIVEVNTDRIFSIPSRSSLL